MIQQDLFIHSHGMWIYWNDTYEDIMMRQQHYRAMCQMFV